jgi:hypothetical protein
LYTNGTRTQGLVLYKWNWYTGTVLYKIIQGKVPCSQQMDTGYRTLSYSNRTRMQGMFCTMEKGYNVLFYTVEPGHWALFYTNENQYTRICSTETESRI